MKAGGRRINPGTASETEFVVGTSAEQKKPATFRVPLFGYPSRFAGWSRNRAGALLAATALAVAWCIWVSQTRQTGQLPPPADPRQRDSLLFQSVVERVHAGQGYYDAWGEEARSRGYPGQSVFNWRLPLFAWLNGRLPTLFWGQALLCAIALASVLIIYAHLRVESGVPVAMAAVVLVGLAVAPCLRREVFLTTDLWVGTLIALSIGAYAHGWRSAAVASGLLALFFRELAAPYCLVALGLACWERRRGEVVAWILGLALFGIYFGYHWLQVAHHRLDTDPAHPQSWVALGGTAFLLTTTGFHILLAELPRWTWAVYLPLGILGLVGWQGATGRLTCLAAGAYLTLFAFVGLPINNYWGLIDAPLLALGFVHAPAAVRDIFGGMRNETMTAQR
jgi:xanthosine utilization system XapX-like protein